jgi:hypothetical protein
VLFGTIKSHKRGEMKVGISLWEGP